MRKIFIVEKKIDGKENKMKEKHLFRKLRTPIILNYCLPLTQHEK